MGLHKKFKNVGLHEFAQVCMGLSVRLVSPIYNQDFFEVLNTDGIVFANLFIYLI